MRRRLLILSGFGYVLFLFTGMDTGLGVYRTPGYCFAALACAVVAAACATKKPRFYWSIAGIAAIACSLYGYHQNREWREKVERFPVKHALPATQTETNK